MKPVHERLARAWYAHPIALISGAATLVAGLTGIWPAVQWLTGHYQTTEDAKAVETRIDRRFAWANVQAIKNEQLALRNRVNDCAILLSKGKPISTLERNACTQYRDEFDDATKRLDDARRAALGTSK